ncbi:hypothetical protein CULT_100018 [[Clostridium] ultunense Esp]|uniref:helix-turn-helix domain-containing protein n=1 Tax=Thermicanus aegyptius TaxID=94009 RepID=UPI0002B6FE6D|nr:helix-turn-helix domain-containing protein [Thermicanus aegyptius]CCQ92481.1 hypothetical protein CULT_100018 [[Clostridium] ultunense Esp]
MERSPKLRELMVRAKSGDLEALEQIISKLNPMIKKISRDLGYDEAYSDLVLWVVNAVHRYAPATARDDESKKDHINKSNDGKN